MLKELIESISGRPSGHASPPPPIDGRPSIAFLVRELRDDLMLVFREEVALAQAQAKRTATRMARNVAILLAGAFIGLLGAALLLFALTAGIAVMMDRAGVDPDIYMWLAPLIVGAIVSIVAAITIFSALAAFKDDSFDGIGNSGTLRGGPASGYRPSGTPPYTTTPQERPQ